MSLRDVLLRRCGPGVLGGVTLGDWFRLLRENRCAIAPTHLPRALSITCHSVQNSLFRELEQWRIPVPLEHVDVPPPIFILGHWRSGTTHLHNLLTVDQRFASPNTYQALFPHAFLMLEALHSRLISWFLPPHRPMDNVEWTMQSPQEDEFALCILTCNSPYMAWCFPERREHYDRYLTLRNVSDHEVEEWKSAMLTFVKRLTWKLRRPLVLKSPPHTCRIRRLLEVFPSARFVHIHRDPLAVFQSTRKMLTVNFQLHGLQRPRLNDLDDRILRQYREMYQVFFDECHLIPAGHFHEICYEELERDPLGQVQRAYEALGLPDFAQARPAVENIVQSIQGFQKNRFPDLDPALQQRITQEWRMCFEAWGYNCKATSTADEPIAGNERI